MLIVTFNSATSQSIRKNYQEMTPTEKSELVDAFYDLGPGIVEEIAIYHGADFNNIHFNLGSVLPYRPLKDVFMAWHRYQMFQMEQNMQDINPNITIPYWDWTEKNYLGLPPGQAPAANDDLFGDDFMGSFNSAWSLGRTFNANGNQIFPTQTDVNVAQARVITDFIDPLPEWRLYSDGIESDVVHFAGHGWTGGDMAGSQSPRDPIFYLHHSNIDRLWQNWVIDNNLDNGANSGINVYGVAGVDPDTGGQGGHIFQPDFLPLWDATAMDPADPAYPNVDQTAVDPNFVVDSRTLGVFYAENTLAELFDYTVSNTYRAQENFYYQYTIEAKNNFIIPSGKDAKLESVNNIILKPGFHAQNGSDFLAKIDTDNDINTTNKTISKKKSNRSNPFSNFRIKENLYSKNSLDREFGFVEYLNEKNKLGIVFKNECNSCEIEITDINKNIVLSKTISFGKKIDIDLQPLVSGIHSLKITNSNNLLIVKELKKL